MSIALAAWSAVGGLVSPAGSRARLSVLLFHRVLKDLDPLMPGTVDATTFSWQMELVHRRFNPLPLSEAVERLMSGSLPDRAICVTFDDGYADNVSVALPILQHYRIPATFFVACGFLGDGIMWNDIVYETVKGHRDVWLDLSEVGLGRWSVSDTLEKREAIAGIIKRLKYLPQRERDARVRAMKASLGGASPRLMMEIEDLRSLAGAGMEIGGHTVTHPILASVGPSQARQEINESKRMLEDLLREPIRLFAYPNGKPNRDYRREHVAMVQEAGFEAAFSTAWGSARRGSDCYQLPRFTPWDRSPQRFAGRLVRNLLRSGELVNASQA